MELVSRYSGATVLDSHEVPTNPVASEETCSSNSKNYSGHKGTRANCKPFLDQIHPFPFTVSWRGGGGDRRGWTHESVKAKPFGAGVGPR